MLYVRCDILTCIQSRCQDFAQEGSPYIFSYVRKYFKLDSFHATPTALIDRVAGGRVRHHVAFADVALSGKDVEDRTEAQAQKVYGHSEMCAGVSVATLQTRHRTAGQPVSLHCWHLSVRGRLML